MQPWIGLAGLQLLDGQGDEETTGERPEQAVPGLVDDEVAENKDGEKNNWDALRNRF